MLRFESGLRGSFSAAMLFGSKVSGFTVVTGVASIFTAPGVRDVAMFGSALHVLVDEAAPRLPELLQRLTAAGWTDVRARRIEPSLEDSFVHLVAGRAALSGASA